VVASPKALGWRECAPSGEVNAFKVFLGIKLADLTRKQREDVLDILRACTRLEGTSQRRAYAISARSLGKIDSRRG
jgi:hypothetical protein